MLFRAPAPRSSSLELTFELPSDHPAGRISVVGTFNGWRPGADAFVAAGPVQRVSVTVPAGEDVTFRYLGQWWFDEPDADWIDDQGSHVAASPALRAPDAEAVPLPASVADAPALADAPRRAEGHTTLSPAEYAVEVAHKRRKKAEKAADKAADKARRKAKKAAAKLQKMEQAGARARRALHDVEDRTERA